MKPVTLILPTYCPTNEVASYLVRCLTTLANSGVKDLANVVVVEQGVPYLSPTLETYLGDNLYLHSGIPLGYARAVNLGVSLARTEYICVINNDLFVPPKWLETMLAEFESIPNCGVLAPFDGPVARLDPKGVVRENEGWWSCVLMKRAHFNNIDGLDDQLLNYRFHDQDFNIRTHMEGLVVARTGKVVVEHIDSATYSRMPERTRADTDEKAEMLRRWGSDSYYGWLASGGMNAKA